MSASNSRDGENADDSKTHNWRNHRNDVSTERRTSDISEGGFQRHFQKRSQYGERSTHEREVRNGRGRGRGRNSNRSSSNRGGHNTQRTDINIRSRNPRHKPHAARGANSPWSVGSRDRCMIQYFDADHLERLSQMNTRDLVTTLLQEKSEFEEFLNDAITSDVLILTLRVLVNLSKSDFMDSVVSILIRACSQSFLSNLETFMTSLCFEKESHSIKHNKLYWSDRNGFWNNAIEIFQKMIEFLPSKARDELTPILGKMDNIITSIESNQDYAIDKKVKESANDMFDKLQEQLKKFETQSAIPKTTAQKSDEEPPENFRVLNIIPTKEDLSNSKPFIRANKITEAYESVEHYLDVQFRLLREDFMAPLREGLEDYLHDPTQRRNSNFRIYRRVRFVFDKTADLQSGYTISFGIKNINWRDSKRLMFGGLLCLSRDNFDTILFATITNRDESALNRGLLVIRPCGEARITQDFYKYDFVMLESKLYFEPYSVVLTTLRRMHDTKFPMRNYLVDADTSTNLPCYLKKEKIQMTYNGFQLPVSTNKEWPSPERLGLDEMQHQAFKCALTEELAIIQGPPGTGKTFLALKIIRTMLENDQNWFKHGPIVIVCLTNHALDQFLEGILQYTDSIVRIGTRSKNPNLEKYSLKNRLHTSRLAPEDRYQEESSDSDEYNWYRLKRRKRRYLPPTYMQQYMFDARDMLNENSEEIHGTHTLIENLTRESAIVPLWQLKKCCSKYEFDNWLLETNFTSEAAEDLMFKANRLEPHLRYELLNQLVEGKVPKHSWAPRPWDRVLFPLDCIDELIYKINTRIDLHRRDTEMYELPFDLTNQWEQDIIELRRLRSSLQRDLAQHPLLNMGDQNHHQDPQWEAYWQLITVCYERATNDLVNLQRYSEYLADRLNTAKQLVDCEELKKYKVIGLTTTAAARLHDTLVSLHAPIVLVEEAAEILEAQVVCSLTESCQHLILIGDHKQLRPKPAVYELGVKYNLNISLFERMVNIRGNHTQLASQHRMRPEIAKLICPSIYETLHNHESVSKHPSVKGLAKNVFFLHHTHEEVRSEYNEDSWANQHEAEFLIALARHFILQGYDSSEVTILCTYAGQLSTLAKEKNRYRILADLRVTTVDNYQGEENKIILLSLVRNNQEGNIGFLKEENRVCVALSRAREGLFIMGNMDNLTTKNHIWPKIKKVLEDDDEIGDSLELRCQNHPEESIRVQKVTDFKNCPEGGCLKKCNTHMPCGHICPRFCHILDPEHTSYECTQPCTKTCRRSSHPCPLNCGQTCKPCLVIDDRKLKCGHTVPVQCGKDSQEDFLVDIFGDSEADDEDVIFRCPVKVDAILPDCNHTVSKPCHKSVAKYPCFNPCDVQLACGHTCELKCHVKEDPEHLEYKCKKECMKNNLNCTMDHACTKQCGDECTSCDVERKKERSCGHYFDCKCNQDVEEILCNKPCKRQLECGHTCQLKCDENCGKCQVKVEKISSCGHKMKVKCGEEATPSMCSSECQRNLPCGHPCTAKCKESCITICKTMTPQTKPGLCGHIFSVPCYMQESGDPQKLVRYCKEPCRAELACGHICKGKCGLCNQGRIHMPCGESCDNILVCGHKCEVSCTQECPPCKKLCEVRCRHNRCKRKCGEPCAPCKMECSWRCPHSRCSKRCFELCDREPCNEPCLQVLKCGHDCVGFCGEPCPQLCRICNKEELMDEFFVGNESDARFVLLEDCGHCIESRRLLEWASECKDSIQMKTCPRCKKCIRKCMRIMNQIKTDLKDVQLTKKKILSDQAQLQNQHRLLLEKVELLAKNPVLEIFSDLQNFLDTFRAKVRPVTNKKKLKLLDTRATEATKIALDILQRVLENLKGIDRTLNISPWLQDQIAMLVQLLLTRGQLTNQELNDIELELRRLRYMAEVCKIDSETILKDSDPAEHEAPLVTVIEKLTSIEKFSESREQDIKNEMMRLSPLFEIQNATILNVERKLTVKALSFKQGHWFKCSSGHIYSIGECDGAMQENGCSECNATVGQQSHQLKSDNALATEMDEATCPA